MKYNPLLLFGYIKPDFYYPDWVVFTLSIAADDKWNWHFK
jgi:hypothetical protein